MTKFYKRIRQTVAVVALASAPMLASAATIDIDVSNITVNNADVVITPSDDDMRYYYNLTTAADFEAKGGVDGIIDSCKASWESMAGMYYESSWIGMIPYVTYTGVQTFTGQDFRTVWDTDYVVYAFGVDTEGNITVPVTTREFRTLPLERSDNTLAITLDKVAFTEGSSIYMDVTVTVTPSNDDPYAVLLQKNTVLDYYDGSDESKSIDAYFASQFDPYVTRTYTGKQTITFTRQKKDTDMYVVAAGFNEAHTTDLYKLAFRTEEYEKPAASLDIQVSNITVNNADVVITPSDDDVRYYYNLTTAADFEAKGGVDGIIDSCKASWENMAGMYYESSWIGMIPYVTYTGVQTFTGQDFRTVWDTDYVVYAFGVDTEGNITVPVTTKEFRTLPLEHSDNTLAITLDKVAFTEGSSIYMDVTVTVTPSNDDPYAVLLQKNTVLDYYDGSDESKSIDAYFASQFGPYVTATYTGRQTITFTRQKKDTDMYVVAAGFNEAHTTDLYKLAFRTEETKADEIAVEVSDIGVRDATVIITPTNDEIHYFCSVMTKAKFFDENNGPEGIYDFDKAWFTWLADLYDGVTWNGLFYSMTDTGSITDSAANLYGENKLVWGQDFVAYAYGINEDGEIITPVNYVEFSTLPVETNTELTFNLSIVDVVKDEGKDTYTARIYVEPSTNDSYAVHYHDVYYYDWYIDHPEYSMFAYLVNQFDKFITDTFTGDAIFTCVDIKEGAEYYFVVTGYDEAPDTDIFKIKFEGKETNSVEAVTDDQVQIRVSDGTLTLSGTFDYGCVYSIDGKAVATFRDNSTVNLATGTYIVETVTAGVRKIRKVFVK